MALATGPLSPYVTPEQVTSAPTGISWQTIPDQRATDAEKYAEVVNICQRATSMVDARCNNVLRATQQTETLYGPDFRVNVEPTGNVRLLLAERPVTQVVGIQVAAANVFPRQWTQVQTGLWAVEEPPLGIYGTSAPADSATGGQSVLLGPGYASWAFGRRGFVVQVTYVSGWPHAGITGQATAGTTSLQVDDCTGWAPAGAGEQGATGVIHDIAGNQEAVTCTASSVATGPGTLTLASPLLYDHDPGIIVTTLPDQVQWATILYASSLALTRGATATVIQNIAGAGETSASGHETLAKQADTLLTPFMRVI